MSDGEARESLQDDVLPWTPTMELFEGLDIASMPFCILRDLPKAPEL